MSRRALHRYYVAFNDATATPVWTEVPGKGWSWTYGRQQELLAIQTARGSVTLDNAQHPFDPLLTNGPYGAGVVPMRRVKVESWWNRLTRNQASVETDTTGWAAGSNTTIARSTTVASDGAASLRLTSTAAGEVSAVATSVPCDAGEAVVAMASFRAAVSARSCRCDLRFVTSTGATISTTTGSTVTSSTGAWAQATVQALAPATAAAVVLIVAVQATAAGSEQHYVDTMAVFPADAGTPAWSRGGPEPAMTGWIPSWEPEYEELNGGSITLATHCGLGVLAATRLPESTYSVAVTADAPVIWWRMGDSSSTMRDSSGNRVDGTHAAGSSAAASLLPAATNGARTLSGAIGQVTEAPLASPFNSATVSLEFWIALDAYGVNGFGRLVSQGLPDNVGFPFSNVVIQPSGHIRWAMGHTGGSGGTDKSLEFETALPMDGTPTHVVITRDNGTFACYKNGVAVTTTTLSTSGSWSTSSASFGSGLRLFWSSSVPAVVLSRFIVDEIAFYNVTLSAAQALEHYQAGLGWPGEDEGARMTRVLDDIGWPAGDRDIGAGASIVQPAVYGGGNALQYMQQLAKSGQGRLFDSPAGLITYRSRWWPLTNPSSTTSQATFGNGAGELPWSDLRPLSDSARIINRVVAQRVGGELIEAEDAASITKYREQADSASDLLYTTDLEVVDYIDWRLDHYAESVPDVRAVVLDPVGGVDLWPQVLTRQLGDRVTVRRWLPDGSLVLDVGFLIELISHTSDEDGSHRTVLAVSRAETRTYLVLDDPTLGQLDTGRLAF
jgi:hypothetical protein